jgi:hypothetical protein
MTNSGYMPTTDAGRVLWFNNFSLKFGTYATSLGFSAAEVTAVNNDAAMLAFLVLLAEIYTNAKKQRVDYKNLIKDGPIGTPGGPVPVAPVTGAVPTVVAPGILPRMALLVQRIKTSPAYTDAIGQDLGIVATSVVALDTINEKPVIKLVKKGIQVEVQWTKGKADGVRIEVDRGTGTWQFLAVDTVPHYTDTAPITAAATWQYRAMYLVNDEMVGQWSDVASIAVS